MADTGYRDSMLQAVFVPEVMELVGRIREGRLRMELMQADDDLLNEMETYAIDRSLQLFSMPDAMAPQEDKFAHRQYQGFLVGHYEMMLNQVRSKPPTVLRAVDIIRLYTTLVDHNEMDPEPIAPVRGDNPHRYVRRNFAHEMLQRAQRALEEPCRAYHYSINNAGIEPLLAIAALAVDYWEIIPFSAFNRRTLSLLIQQQLLQHGYSVFRYISFEPLFLNDDLFYSAMRASTLDWIHCRNDYLPFTLFFLRIVAQAYDEFFVHLGQAPLLPRNKQQRLRTWVKNRIEPFNKRLIASAFPDISLSTIEVVLHELMDEGVITRIGAGRGAGYTITKD